MLLSTCLQKLWESPYGVMANVLNCDIFAFEEKKQTALRIHLLAERVQTLIVAVCISHNANNPGNDMNLTIIPPATGKLVGQTWLFNHGMATGVRDGKLRDQTSCKPKETLAPPSDTCLRYARCVPRPAMNLFSRLGL